MKFDLNTDLFDEATKKIMLTATPGITVEPMPLSKLLLQLLILSGDDKQPAADKTTHFLIVRKVAAAVEADGIVDLSVADLAAIKKLADNGCRTLIHGRLLEALDNPVP